MDASSGCALLFLFNSNTIDKRNFIQKILFSSLRIKHDSLTGDMPDEIVVDIEVPFLVAVYYALLADLDFLDEPHQRRPVKLSRL